MGYDFARTFRKGNEQGNAAEMGQAQKNLKGLKPEDAVKDIAGVPLHPGAERYYREIGVLK